MDLTSFFSMGIILGTALVIAIPEGIETLYQSADQKSNDMFPQYIGLGLISGFLIMYIIDHLNAILHSFNIELKSINEFHYNGSYRDLFTSIFTSSLTLGLIFHAMIDGISLGSSFSKSHDESSIGLILFIMIIIHKLPTCFSLSSLLMKEEMNKSVLKFHLLIFASITPLSSILTFIFMSLFHLQNDFVVGNLLVFSGGTFLYVVTHVMLEVSSTNNMIPQSGGSDDTLYYGNKPTIEGIHILASLVGTAVPVLISLFGEH
ncbi:uncharacterized protein AC631_03653 [Debaryomyces fabryi]|uniref:Zinc/iron permease n=1 Tax=Debaryomyces fabryi TaxID=58627 RepID=A0A0V1PWQ4_9ASCO|nr:uncharacterized protein AC631_03653 [Debaryomyces fabryi]KSA00608.1 hypothetical protein AC631_03653 [Debaryomyces fabryi]